MIKSAFLINNLILWMNQVVFQWNLQPYENWNTGFFSASKKQAVTGLSHVATLVAQVCENKGQIQFNNVFFFIFYSMGEQRRGLARGSTSGTWSVKRLSHLVYLPWLRSTVICINCALYLSSVCINLFFDYCRLFNIIYACVNSHKLFWINFSQIARFAKCIRKVCLYFFFFF